MAVKLRLFSCNIYSLSLRIDTNEKKEATETLNPGNQIINTAKTTNLLQQLFQVGKLSKLKLVDFNLKLKQIKKKLIFFIVDHCSDCFVLIGRLSYVREATIIKCCKRQFPQ